MLYPARTVFVFGWYLLLMGAGLLVLPGLVLGLVGAPTTIDAPWLQLLGFALMVLGYYYLQAARANLTPFFRWTVGVRIVQFFVISYLAVVIFPAYRLLVALAAIELASGLWTWQALRRVPTSL